jgi:hypothetical protein
MWGRVYPGAYDLPRGFVPDGDDLVIGPVSEGIIGGHPVGVSLCDLAEHRIEFL